MVGVEDTVSYNFPLCTSAVCRDMGVFIYQSTTMPASSALLMILLD